jgi:hypothetical protein
LNAHSAKGDGRARHARASPRLVLFGLMLPPAFQKCGHAALELAGSDAWRAYD